MNMEKENEKEKEKRQRTDGKKINIFCRVKAG